MSFVGSEIVSLDSSLQPMDHGITFVAPANIGGVMAAGVADLDCSTCHRTPGGTWADGVFHQAQQRNRLEILDRVGGGDSFASGVAYGFLAGDGPQMAVEDGAAHGALAMTTPGDTSISKSWMLARCASAKRRTRAVA